MNVSRVSLQGEISSKEEEMLWLEVKGLWISGQGEDTTNLGKGESLDTPNPMAVEFESKERSDERLAKLFQQDDSSETNFEVHVLSPLTSETATLNLQVGDQGRRYPLVIEVLEDHKWKSVMVEEMKALQKNSTWELVELPQEKMTVGCKWVFSVKYKLDRIIGSHKARLVVKGYIPTYGIDYQDTFAFVAKMNTLESYTLLPSIWTAHYDSLM
ncbi:Retrovirus-related Pol polyprotein from transposon RE1 [Vitis vinifera]|uniref:Retrovirus-related Pol polyprotein from transposon RE1 n=1 Tax=Vitis vinifera TaxID=29760 RepID=A0A438HTL8_VITVI|nr:Retrovirus-related Pol polyprotein from transposon RE1 [Vitis vinifera]